MIDSLTTMKAEIDELRAYTKHLETIINDLKQTNQDLKYQLVQNALKVAGKIDE